MQTVELSAGTIEYRDDGPREGAPVLVLLHGLLMDGAVWDDVVERLREDHRCIRPTLPLGAHRIPLRPEADRTLAGQARIVAELLDRLELDDVVLVVNDWNPVPPLIALGLAGRVGRIVVTSAEAFDNYPPGLPGRLLVITMRVPGGLWFALQQLRLRPLRRLPATFGWMTRRGVPEPRMRAWIAAGLASRAIRRDVIAYGTSVPERAQLLEWAERQREFDRPVLIAWAREDRVMPPEHGRRLAEIFPRATHVEIPDAYTLIPIDQPAALAARMRQWLAATAAAAPGTAPSRSRT